MASTRAYVAELLGTFLFLTIGYLSVAAFAAASSPAPNLLVVPFSFGFGLLAAIFAFGHISGGHFNPAVTVADGARPADDAGRRGRLHRRPGHRRPRRGPRRPDRGQPGGRHGRHHRARRRRHRHRRADHRDHRHAGFMLVILAATKRASALAALAIPLALVAIHFATATLSGASLNPARSIGSALVGAGHGRAVDLPRRSDRRRRSSGGARGGSSMVATSSPNRRSSRPARRRPGRLTPPPSLVTPVRPPRS